MAGEIFFKSGSKSAITTQAPLTPSYKAGTVYFAVDDSDNGFIYFDYGNKRIPMTAAATSAINDSNGHKIIDHYVHSIAHSNNYINYTNGNGDSLGSFAIPGAFFVKGTQTAATNVWTGALPSGVTQYYEGLSIAYFLPYAGTSTAATLNLGGLGAKPVILGENATGTVTTHYAAKQVIWMTYLTDSGVNSGNGYWKISAARNSTYYYTTAYCGTAAGTAAKVGNVSYYTLQPGYIPVMFIYANTAQSALTLNINSTGAKPLYINGVASSSSNYTIPRDVYMVYYDGVNYYLRTDGILPGIVEKAIADGSGNEIESTYIKSLSISGTTITIKKGDDTTSTISTQDTKNTAGATQNTSKLFLIGATAQNANPQTYSSSKVYVTDGTLTAPTFSGNLSGNADTATKATQDGGGNNIEDTYIANIAHTSSTTNDFLQVTYGSGTQTNKFQLTTITIRTWN